MEKKETFDIVIYGAGLATIFLLEQFKDTNIKIAIIESGNFDEINEINTIDQVTGPIKLYTDGNKERAESFFGTAALWKTKGVGGKLQKFDENDFSQNNWPFTYNTIDTYYNLVIKKILDVAGVDIYKDFIIKNHVGFLNVFQRNFNWKSASTTLSYNFNKMYKKFKKDLLKQKNFYFFFNTKLLTFKHDFENKTVDYSECLYENKKIHFFTKSHVLSCGCLENNRLILNTFREQEDYIKLNNIGNYISFHPHVNLGYYQLNKSLKNSDLKKTYNPQNQIIFLKSKNEKFQNAVLALVPAFYRGKNFFYNKTVLKYLNYIDKINFSLLIEHKTSMNNKIFLSNKKSQDGLFKININTEISKENTEMIQKSHIHYSKLLNEIKILDLYEFNSNEIDIKFETNNHHHGGLIFGDGKNVPVDNNFLLKNFNNLYINGSSLFPSSSFYGPTFTIMALSMMLSDVLKKNLKLIN